MNSRAMGKSNAKEKEILERQTLLTEIKRGEAQIARSDILEELAISDDLKIDTDMFDELQIIAANNS